MIRRTTLLRGAVVVITTALGLLLLARVSAVALPFRTAEQARLRLSWSAHPERIEVCRARSREELEREPEHMRQRIECSGNYASYELRVLVDQRVVRAATVRGGGFRHDRPLHLLEEVPIPPGSHRVQLSFLRRERPAGDTMAAVPTLPAEADTGLFAGRAQREVAERARRRRAAIPSRLSLDTALVLAPNVVALITYDAERKLLVLRTEASLTR